MRTSRMQQEEKPRSSGEPSFNGSLAPGKKLAEAAKKLLDAQRGFEVARAQLIGSHEGVLPSREQIAIDARLSQDWRGDYKESERRADEYLVAEKKLEQAWDEWGGHQGVSQRTSSQLVFAAQIVAQSFPPREYTSLSRLEDMEEEERNRGNEKPEIIFSADLSSCSETVPPEIRETIASVMSRISADPDLHLSDSMLGDHIATHWLTPIYLGKKTHSRFSKTPPVLLTGVEELLKGHGGIYIHRSNIACISSRYTEQDDKIRGIVHELLHYVAYLGGGGYCDYWTVDNRKLNVYLHWMHEGLTELHAQQMVREKGCQPNEISYYPEVCVVHALQALAGKDVLRNAFLTGDFSEVKREVDEKLGSGTFLEFSGLSLGAWESYSYLFDKLLQAGFDHTKFLDPKLI